MSRDKKHRAVRLYSYITRKPGHKGCTVTHVYSSPRYHVLLLPRYTKRDLEIMKLRDKKKKESDE
jgi:hypothetical protein